MRPVDQTRFGAEGNCYQACLASLLHLRIEDVPDFGDDFDNAKVNAWLRPRGLYAVTMHGPQTVQGVAWHVPGYYIMGGRSAGGPHGVVARGPDIVHDPNPSRAGLVTREDCTILIPYDPSEVR